MGKVIPIKRATECGRCVARKLSVRRTGGGVMGKVIPIKRATECGRCGGIGSVPVDPRDPRKGDKTCSQCGGRGEL